MPPRACLKEEKRGLVERFITSANAKKARPNEEAALSITRGTAHQNNNTISSFQYSHRTSLRETSQLYNQPQPSFPIEHNTITTRFNDGQL